ncbi:MAG TPA: ABC transporter permease [Pyrinomonadaceae bacterium]|jgi:predicted permease|nr:ABC transporter permease [Pyrinomonadaceae bacterium]
MFHDVRYALRILLKKPAFTIIVVLTLALGIGANAAIFSVVKGVLLNPLPFPNPEQLVTFHQSKPNFDTGAIPYPNFVDLQRENQTFSSMAISRGAGYTLLGAGEAERVTARMVSADFFTVYGIKPALGRNFTGEDDRKGADPVTIISDRLWARKFNSASDLVDKSITLDDRSYRVIGILPASYKGTVADVYVPIGAWPSPVLQSRTAALGIHGVGRMKPGVSVEQAQADLNRIMATLAEMYPEANKGHGSKVISLKERLVGDVQPVLLMLFAAVGLVLLIACVNVSNLMLARATGRTREFAIRAALGAGRWRLLRQSLIESTMLALIGGAAGLFIAAWGTTAAIKALPTALPRAEEISLDGRVLLFTIGISLLTGIVSGLAPALKTSQWRFSDALKESGRGTSTTRARAQGAFVIAEMAMALVLLIGAGLLIRSLNALWNIDPGFKADNVVTFGVTFPPSMRSAKADASRAYLRDLSNRLNEMPGVTAASLTAAATPLVSEDDRYFWVDGQPKPTNSNDMNMALFYMVEPGYLEAMGIHLKKGRFFTNQDDERSTRVIVVDEKLAQQKFGSDDVIGKRLNLDDDGAYEIVGVVGHVKQWSLDTDERELQAQMYVPFRAAPDAQVAGTGGMGVVLRADNDINPSFITAIRDVVQQQNNQNVISNTATMNETIADSLAQRRFAMIVLGSFAATALLLASLGIYGVISYLVGQRTHELGIRVALGASRGQIFTLVLGHGLKMTLAGVVLGLVAAFGLTRLIRTMLYGVGATDPVTFATIAVLLTLVALVACYLPARRATKVDPLTALRSE